MSASMITVTAELMLENLQGWLVEENDFGTGLALGQPKNTPFEVH